MRLYQNFTKNILKFFHTPRVHLTNRLVKNASALAHIVCWYQLNQQNYAQLHQCTQLQVTFNFYALRSMQRGSGTWLPLCLFWNDLQEIKRFGHFLLFYDSWKKLFFEACFGEIWAKLTIYYEILSLNLIILTNFRKKFGLFWSFWPFFLFGLFFGLFETAYDQIWPFNFFWTWQPWSAQIYWIKIYS